MTSKETKEYKEIIDNIVDVLINHQEMVEHIEGFYYYAKDNFDNIKSVLNNQYGKIILILYNYVKDNFDNIKSVLNYQYGKLLVLFDYYLKEALKFYELFGKLSDYIGMVVVNICKILIFYGPEKCYYFKKIIYDIYSKNKLYFLHESLENIVKVINNYDKYLEELERLRIIRREYCRGIISSKMDKKIENKEIQEFNDFFGVFIGLKKFIGNKLIKYI